MTIPGVQTIGFIGAGQIGTVLARKAIDSGYDVVLSNSRGPDTLADLVAELGPRARAGTAEEAAAAGDLVVVTIPLKNIDAVPVEPLAGKVVVDTNNYYPQRDGQIAALDDKSATTSGLLQAHLPESKVVKAFNHIYAADIGTDGRPAGTPGRRALVVSSNDPAATAQVSTLIEEFGFDVVDAGPLSDSWRIERDTPGYARALDAAGLTAALAAAQR